MATNIDGILSSKVSPKFLHANSTSHTWPFSAIAELIDNAYDPDVSASELWIDRRRIGETDCLTFVDNGNGMAHDKLHKMLSFGYCEKVQVGNVKPIGYYGNGFKSGSMRLGKDALVFTRTTGSTSVGFLSQTYLTAINADAVFVPIVTWKLQKNDMLITKTVTSEANLKAILQYSVFKTEKALLKELDSLKRMRTGTHIIIYNLRKDKQGKLELDFSSDAHDIRNPETPVIDLTSINRPVYTASPEYRRSLREYCSILYLKPRMKIVLRQMKVKTKLISKSLSQTEKDVYKPTWLTRPVRMTFGFTSNTEPDSYGLMMYHKNRLIRAYEKVGCQKQANGLGVGVLGVVEVNFLEPIHNKQEFNRTDKYMSFMQNAGIKLNDYYNEKTQNKNLKQGRSSQAASQLPDWTWAQCDNCLSWRRLPTGYTDKLPDKWYCYLNPDAHFNRCDIPEEPEDDDEALQPTYTKTYKKTQEERKRAAKAEEERRIKEKELLLQKKEQILNKKAREISRQQEELAEVSSSQDRVDRKPTIADLEKAKKNIQEYHEKLTKQQNVIEQLEKQKTEIEAKSKAMLRMAESIKLTNSQSKSLMDKVESLAGTSSSKVTSSSHTLRAPKRKSMSHDGSGEKVTKVKTEDGGFIRVRMASGDKVIDLTSDEEDSVTPAGDAAMEVGLPQEGLEGDQAPESGTVLPQGETSNRGRDKNTVAGGNKDEIVEKSGEDSSELGMSDSVAGTASDGQETEMASESVVDNVPVTEKPMDTSARVSGDSGDVKPDMAQLDKQISGTKQQGQTSEASNNGDDKSDASGDSNVSSRPTQQPCPKPSENTIQQTDKQQSGDQNESDQTENKTSESETKVKTSIPPSEIKDEKKDVKQVEIKKDVIDNSVQTVPVIVNFASTEEVDLLKLSATDQSQMLLQKSRELDEKSRLLEETQKRLKGLQGNIWQLLKIIVSDFDYGEPENIENVILDFLKVNEDEQGDQTSSTTND